MPAIISPTLSYDDAAAALDFLERAFGFTRGAVHTDDEGRVAHAEVWYRGACIMLGTTGVGNAVKPTANGAAYVAVEDARAHHDRAVAAGAEIATPLTEQDYGSLDYTARDPQGTVWHFGTYVPEPPEAA